MIATDITDPTTAAAEPGFNPPADPATTAANETAVLFVDDDANVLAAYRRMLSQRFRLETAASGAEGLQRLREGGPFAVVVSDLQMPAMNGIQFLSRAREVSPDTVRMMLTGQADLSRAIDAVNEGHLFRFLTKPCPADMLAKAVEAGLRQYQLARAEKDLLQETLRGAVKVLVDVLSLVNPPAFGRAARVRRLARQVAEELRLEDAWQVEIAAMLSQLGCVTVPEKTLHKHCLGQDLTPEEWRMVRRQARIGADLLRRIPRLEAIAEMIARQDVPWREQRERGAAGEAPGGADVLKAAVDLDTLISSGRHFAQALAALRGRRGEYHPAVLTAIERVQKLDAGYQIRQVALDELRPGMILAQDVATGGGMLLLARGQEATESVCQRLCNMARIYEGLPTAVKVMVPRGQDNEGS
ncbi:MAG: Hydrogenase transcriptional regulatory protein hupR1 [candidate division BRC1 bacterium ADurb.BinA292]|nr:MAG: Hydrogenase transcriptional regulatory protein hupR1 [candidate division BRC1 bacterium ADurb.BinA292]HOR28795.1 response regulator [Candidatus Sumerlaeota bacterium]